MTTMAAWDIRNEADTNFNPEQLFSQVEDAPTVAVGEGF